MVGELSGQFGLVNSPNFLGTNCMPHHTAKGNANLNLVFPMFQLVFSLPGIIGAGVVTGTEIPIKTDKESQQFPKLGQNLIIMASFGGTLHYSYKAAHVVFFSKNVANLSHCAFSLRCSHTKLFVHKHEISDI